MEKRIQASTVPPFGTPINNAHPMAHRLKACWLFNTGAGQCLVDSSGNLPPQPEAGASSSLVNWQTGGRNGPAAKINGTDSSSAGYWNFGDQLDLRLNDLTIACWFKTTDTDFNIFAKSKNAGGGPRIVFGLGNGGNFQCFMDFPASVANSCSLSLVNTGLWVHVLWSVNRIGNGNMYINGALNSTANFSGGAAVDMDSVFVSLIGAYNDVAGTGVLSTLRFNGSIESLMMWHRAFTPGEAYSHYLDSYQMFNSPRSSRIFSVPAGGIGRFALLGVGR